MNGTFLKPINMDSLNKNEILILATVFKIAAKNKGSNFRLKDRALCKILDRIICRFPPKLHINLKVPANDLPKDPYGLPQLLSRINVV